MSALPYTAEDEYTNRATQRRESVSGFALRLPLKDCNNPSQTEPVANYQRKGRAKVSFIPDVE